MALLFWLRQTAMSAPCVVIATDHRLLRAANAEGFPTLNPQTLPMGDLADFLAVL